MEYHTCKRSGHGSVFENNDQPFKFNGSNSAKKSQFCKRSGNRQCRNGHSEGDLANFGPITSNSWFIMSNLGCNWAIVNQNFVGIGPKLAISDRLYPLRHGGYRSTGRLLKWTIMTELETANLNGCPVFMITVSWPLHERMWYFTSL